MRTLRSRPQTSRIRLLALVVVVVAFILFLSANSTASFYTDWLWFDNMGQGSVWTTILSTRFLLGFVFSAVFFAILWGNLYLADRVKPEIRAESPEEDLIERYHAVVGVHAGKVRLAVAALFGLIAGANTSSQWETWLLFRNGGDFGETDALFNEDVGFYVFRLPFWTFLIDWFFAALVLTLIVVLVAHYLNGGIRAAVAQERVSSAVKFHLSILLAVLALLRAGAYWLDRYHLVTSNRGAYDGALATDVNIQLPALNLLTLISLFCAVLFVANIRRPGWSLPVAAIGIWLVSHFVIGGIFPLVYQRVRVEPVESQREAPFVVRNIEATRSAYGLDAERVTTVQLDDYKPDLTGDDVAAYQDVLLNAPVIDPLLATEEVTRSEAARQFYRFSTELDVDRYQVGDQTRPVVLSGRGLNIDEVGDSWERQHVIFTHGYGVAMAAAYDDDASGGAQPLESNQAGGLNFLIKGLGDTIINEAIDITVEQPRIYYGEGIEGYAIVGAARDEVDYQDRNNESVPFRYEGTGGVPMGSFLRRAAFSLRFREPDPLISRNVTDTSKVIYNRDIYGRVRELAPFLRFDRNPYPILAEGKIYWVIDAYTTTDDFPYSQSVVTSIAGDSELSGGYNYVRNSVKVVVDAYNGDVDMFVVDESDPLIEAWQKVFPDLFTPGTEMLDSIRDHMRYPEDLFTVQTDMWSSYVVTDATQFIQGDVAWSVASQPRTEAQVSENDAAATVSGSMAPQYLMARPPGTSESEFVLQRAFVPKSGAAGTSTDRPELTAIMMARSDPENYGELVLVRLPAGQVDAPGLVHSEIRKNDDLTQFIKDRAGAKVLFGEMSIMLIEDTIVYIRPVYVEANSATAVPELQRIVAVNGDRIFMGRTIGEAIRGVTNGPATVEDGDDADDVDDDAGDSAEYDPTGKSVVELIADAEQLLSDAGQAEANGLDQSAQRLRARAGAALIAAQELLGGTPSKTPTTAPALDAEPEEDQSATDTTVSQE